MSTTIETARREELPLIVAMLEEADLPIDGVDDAASFLVARENEQLVGCIGLEAYEDVGLLRSLVVRPETRGAGVGKHLVERLVEDARARGMSALYLLTTTADEYFPRFGFEPVARDDADARLRASAEFRGACPDSAVCMRIRL
jgi:N-acetylglutamate synthase-like GNAT family acetyltransferase